LSFTPLTNFSVGANPQAVATADFNNDGRLDVVTANYDAGSVSVLLGNGQGGFGAAISSPAGANPNSLAVGDFNSDGKLDLAAANDGTTGVSLMFGNGDGSFRAPVSLDIGSEARSVAVGDFNGDGKIDLGVTSNVYTPGGYDYYYGYYGSYDGRANVLLGNGAGSFSPPITTALGYGYHTSAAMADFNGDGNDDFAAVNSDYGTVSVSLGSRAGAPLGAPTSFATGWYPQAVTVGDFTGDGILDLVTAGQTVDILPGIGDGTFQGVSRQYVDPTAIAVADFNADGRLDVVTADPWGQAVSVFLGRGDGTLTPRIDHAVASAPTAVAVGDFNRDGRADVASANAGSGTVSVLLNDRIWPALNAPSISVGDATLTEGNTGTLNMIFTVSITAVFDRDVTVRYATSDGNSWNTATAGIDYQSRSGQVTIPAGNTSATIAIPVYGDRLVENSETFSVRLTDPTNAFIADGSGVATIVDNEPRISINNVSKSEGNGKKTTLYTFTVTLSAAYDQAVTMSYRTVDGTATTGDGDYIGKTGTLTFAPGETTKTITIEVKADNKRELNESFYLDLFGNSSNSTFTKFRGVGTIWNDDK
jgi:hypothetical protein